MKNLKRLEDFNNENMKLDIKQCNYIFGGNGETNNTCFTMNDTCIDNRSDVRMIREVDGVVIYDKTCSTEMELSQ